MKSKPEKPFVSFECQAAIYAERSASKSCVQTGVSNTSRLPEVHLLTLYARYRQSELIFFTMKSTLPVSGDYLLAKESRPKI